ncbi:MAG: DMT family transporter [Marivita sp.]|uniref:DMT family transporter n=1 Tax=Marivita sp. TaxID=2003365 RepID=UPI0025C481BA|nr:DMT family transporter [Marivita sp.]MCI5109839.1 DMT family transporter [Marivita sp.]
MSIAVFAVILSIVLVGATLAMQAPANAVLARALGDPVAAAALSFGIGFVILSVIVLLRGGGPAKFAALNSVPWWALSGGALGALWVLAAILAVPRLGVVTMFSAMIFGQLIAALLIDRIGGFGLQPRDLNPSRLLAVALVGVGVMLSHR